MLVKFCKSGLRIVGFGLNTLWFASCFTHPAWDNICKKENHGDPSLPGMGCVEHDLSQNLVWALLALPPNSQPLPVLPVATVDTRLKVFRTDIGYRGNMGGITGADTNCNDRAMTLGYSGVYKAMLGNRSGIPRVACWNDNCSPTSGNDGDGWVLLANTTYYRAEDFAVVGTTTGYRVFTFPLTNAFTSDSTAGIFVWSYISKTWRPQEFGFGSTEECLQWTSSLGSQSGLLGNATSSTTGDSMLYNNITADCDQFRRLFCVQQ